MNIDINQEPIEILFNINNILKQNQLGEEEKQQLSDICDILLEKIITLKPLFFKSSNNSFNFNNIDMNTILKMKSVMEKMNNKNDPRSNLLYSLKPYLREGRKEKLDQYANLLNVAKIAELLKNDNKENPNA